MRRALVFPFLVALSACTAGPDYVRPDISAAQAQPPQAVAAYSADQPWWAGFEDPVLNQLEERALKHNLSTEQALARLDQARAAAGIARAAQLPSFQARGAGARTRQSLNSGMGQLLEYVPDLPRTADSVDLVGSASWDLDFAGGVRRRQEAAKASVMEAQAGVEAARLAVSAELAASYFRLRMAKAQREALVALEASTRRRALISAARLSAGDMSVAESERMEAAAEQAASAVPEVTAQIEAEIARLAVLVGQDTDPPLQLGGDFLYDAPDPLNDTTTAILRRRPDVAAAEARLVASNALIGAALSEYWPSLSLGGLLGVQSGGLSRLFTNDALTAQGSLGLRWRVFDFGRLDAEVAMARGRYREMLAAYRETVLRAAADVESGHATLIAARESLVGLTAEYEARRRLHTRLEAAARAGGLDQDQLLVSQIQLAETEFRLADARGRQALALVAISRALGPVVR